MLCNSQRFFRFDFGNEGSIFLAESLIVHCLRMCVFFVCVEVNSLCKAFQTDEAEVRLFSAVNQLMSL